MGFNLKRRVTTHCSLDSVKLTEKRLKETRDSDSNKSLVSVVDCDLSLDTLPPYDSFPLEAQLASGIPLNQINPTILSDTPQNVETLVDNIISDKNSSATTSNND